MTDSPKMLEPGQFVRLGATVIEERNGRAVIRLPNGSKTTVDFDALHVDGGVVDFVREQAGGERAHCGRCDWAGTAGTRIEAEELHRAHWRSRHGVTSS